jgi:hypothetical protein
MIKYLLYDIENFKLGSIETSGNTKEKTFN